MTSVPEPRKPLSVGAVVVWTIINPLFGLIALGVRNSEIRRNERGSDIILPPAPRGNIFAALGTLLFWIILPVVLLVGIAMVIGTVMGGQP